MTKKAGAEYICFLEIISNANGFIKENKLA